MLGELVNAKINDLGKPIEITEYYEKRNYYFLNKKDERHIEIYLGNEEFKSYYILSLKISDYNTDLIKKHKQITRTVVELYHETEYDIEKYKREKQFLPQIKKVGNYSLEEFKIALLNKKQAEEDYKNKKISKKEYNEIINLYNRRKKRHEQVSELTKETIEKIENYKSPIFGRRRKIICKQFGQELRNRLKSWMGSGKKSDFIIIESKLTSQISTSHDVTIIVEKKTKKWFIINSISPISTHLFYTKEQLRDKAEFAKFNKLL